MNTVDKLLVKVISFPVDQLSLSLRDKKVLKSLHKIISSPHFITENQGKLLVKIFKENSEKFNELSNEICEAIEVPTWSKPFRQVDKTRKMYINSHASGNSVIFIEFTYSSAIRQTITSNSKNISGLGQEQNGKFYVADLTEKNIVKLVDMLRPLDFEIEGKIIDFYKTIKSWSENEVKSQFLITNISHTNFQKAITQDLGIDTAIDNNIIKDRSIRYQYFVENTEKNPENLTEQIAYRKNTRIWINRKEHSLDEVLDSLIKLKRLPVMLVFDSNDHKKCLEEMKNLHVSLQKNGIFDKIGVYFRLPNDEVGTQFNKFIADNKYNAELNNETKIVAVQNGKIPKFFIKNDWRPMSVVSIGTPLRHTKTSVFANHCDLIISHTDQQPIIEMRSQWG